MTQSDADWLEQAARYFEKRPTGGEDMAFWANVSNAERCRSIASAFRASSGVGAKIKPLEWGKTSYGRPEVDTVVGVYRVFEHINGGWAATFKTFNLVDPHGRKNFATEAEAIAAAEADYRQRILSCLSSPLPTVEGRLPTREEVASAASILLMCNGHELHTWGAGDLLDDFAMHALRALSQNKGE